MLGSIFSTINIQLILIIDTPTLTDKGWDTCQGCPDAMMYNNNLVPPCLLERVKAGEDIAVT